MRIARHVSELIGNTPLVQLNSVVPPGSGTVAAKIEYLNPGGSLEGPHRDQDDRRRRGQRRAAARRHHRRTDLGQHRCRPGPGRPAARLQVHLRLPRQGQRGQAERVCAPTAPTSWSARRPCPRTIPASYYSVSNRLVRGDRRRVEARPVLQPDGAGQPLRDHRTRDLGRHRRQGHPLRRGRRHRRHHHRCRPLPQGGVRRQVKIVGVDPEGSVYSGGTGRPYLVEGVGEDFWPSAYDPSVPDEIIAVSDADSFDMTRRLAREEALLVGGSCGMAAVAAIKVAERAGPDVARRGTAARRRTRLSVKDLQRRVDVVLRIPAQPAGRLGRGVDGRRRAARQVRCAARSRAHPSVGDGA